ncbi:hypothetical protein [Hymenobacter terrenus]|uniref:hypothetical protein n=1 Tax=Hymenobacter terrenus TaxID=1629124 RepID=UPI000619121A|nr:hypothetical protein [Hymenobacter terrenus]
MTYNVQEGQSLIDLAVQLYGDPQLVFKLAIDNGLTLDSVLDGSMAIQYDETLTQLSPSAAYLTQIGFAVNTYTPFTAIPPDLLEHSWQEHQAAEHN